MHMRILSSPGKSSPFAPSRTARALFCAAAALTALFAAPATSQAAFHLWNITEVYTNSSGTLQFIELKDPAGFQQFVGSQQISVTNTGNTITHSFTLPPATLPGNSLNHSLLFGTAGLAAAGGPVPDYILPDNFLFAAGGSISFFGANGGGYTALPTDGTLSRTWNGGNAVNTPTNYLGQTGTVVVPEPATFGLFSTFGAALAVFGGRRNRR